MCRVFAYIGPEIPLESLLMKPENSLINQSLDPELHPHLQLAGWGFGIWSEHLVNPDAPLLYHRPKAAFYDDNVEGIVPSLQCSTLLSHVRASGYDSSVVQTDENCHPFSFDGTPWIIAQNGALPNWRILQRGLLTHCKDKYLKQMRGTTDTEFLYVLLLSLLEGDSDEDVQKGFEKLLAVIVQAMKKLDLPALTKLKIALVAPNLQDYEDSYKVDACPEGEATSAIFASEPLTEDGDAWVHIAFGEMVALERKGDKISKKVTKLNV